MAARVTPSEYALKGTHWLCECPDHNPNSPPTARERNARPNAQAARVSGSGHKYKQVVTTIKASCRCRVWHPQHMSFPNQSTQLVVSGTNKNARIKGAQRQCRETTEEAALGTSAVQNCVIIFLQCATGKGKRLCVKPHHTRCMGSNQP